MVKEYEMDERRLLKRKHQLIQKGNNTQLAVVCNHLAEHYTQHGSHEAAIHEYMYAARLYKEMENQTKYGQVNRMIGEIYMILAEYDKALEHENIHYDIAKKENDELEQQRALASIGRTYLTKGITKSEQDTLKLAYKAFVQSLRMSESIQNISKQERMDMCARLLLNIGIVLEQQLKIDDAIEYMNKSIKICKHSEIYEQLHLGYNSLGSLYLKLFDYDKAIQYYNLAIEVAERLSDKIPPMCSSLLAKSEVLIKLADFASAKQLLLKAWKLKTPSKEERNTIEHNLKVVAAMCNIEDSLLTAPMHDYKTKKIYYEKMGDGACDLKNYTSAIEYYKKMLDCSIASGATGKDLITSYVSLAQTYKDNKNYEAAIEYFYKEYEISRQNPKEGCATLLNIADVLDVAGKPLDEIMKVLEQARSEVRGDELFEGKVVVRMVHLLKRRELFSKSRELEKELMRMDYIPSDSEDEEEHGTPNIGDEIDIDEITDLSDNEDPNDTTVQSKSTRTRGKQYKIRKNPKGETQLHVACINGNVSLVKHLLDQGHPPNVRDNCGWLPLHEACNFGHTGIVELLLDKNASINDRGGTLCGGVTPLHDACSNGHLELIELMLDRGASPLVQNDKQETPLDMLIAWKNRDDFDFDLENIYERIVNRMTTALEKTGRNFTSPKEKENTIAFNTSDYLPRRSPRNLTPLKEIGSLRHSLDLDDPVPCSSRCEDEVETNARSEYQQVMENVRKRGSQLKKQFTSPQKSQPALVTETSQDDWLVDDLAPNKSTKKRKTTSNLINTSGMRRSSSSFSSTKRTSPKSTPEPEFDSNGAPIEIDDDSSDSSSSNKRRKTQSSLLNAGFSRRLSDDSNYSNNNTTPVTIVDKITNKVHKRQTKLNNYKLEPDSTTNSSENVSQINRSMYAVNVRIDSKLFRIPVSAHDIDNMKIEWLASQAAKRYYRQEGISPTLRLETKEGAILENEDPLSLVFLDLSQPDEVQSTIISWNLPPLPERYLEACSASKIEVNPSLREHLDSCQGTLNLNLKNFHLVKPQLTPLFRSLNRQNNLQQLDLSGNSLLNEGVQLLCTALPSLTQLRSLNLSSNNITSEAVRYLSQCFQNTTKPVLEFLVDLNLSMNLIADDSLTYLDQILRHVKIRVLNLSGCNFTENMFESLANFNLNFEYLESFDISYNDLSNDSIIMFISFLNFNVVKNLNFSHNLRVRQSGIAEELAENIRQCEAKSLKLQCLNLARCHVNDTEIWALLRSLMHINDLETLNLSYNCDLTSVSLRRLIQHKPSFKNIILEGCTNIIEYLDQCNTNLVPSSEFIPTNQLKSLKISINYIKHSKQAEFLVNMWQKEWGTRGRIEKLFGDFIHLSVCD